MAVKRGLRIGLIVIAVLLGLFAAAPFVLRPPKVPPEAIRTSVTRTPALLERAWALPAAAAFQKKLVSQSNGSFCGPASLANVFRSLGEAATREDSVLAGTGKCWTGWLIERPRLFAAIDTLDGEHKRGLLQIE